MSHKYAKINKEQVVELHKTNKVVSRLMICEKYNCSMYSVRQIIEDLLDEKSIRTTKHGYKLNN